MLIRPGEPVPLEVPVPPALSRLRGAQDPAHSDGSAVGESIMVTATAYEWVED